MIKGVYKVIVAGQDVTSRFSPHFLSLEIQKSAGEATDSLTLELSDQNGQLFMPQGRAPVQVFINGEPAFDGFVSEVTGSIDKGGGRKMSVTASSVDQGSKAKEPALRHKDDASLEDVAKEWGSKAGLTVSVGGSIASINRPYWLSQNESFLSWGQRIGRELGGTFKVVGSRAFLVARNEGLSVSGKTLTPINATVGGNLLEGSITPIISRPKYKKTSGRFFDRNEGEHVEVEVDTPVDGVEVKMATHFRQPHRDGAQSKADSDSREADREQGSGSVTIIGDARAEPEAECRVSGWRAGIDGTYRIDTVGLSIDKSGGFKTTLGLKQPKGSAGKDTR